jgi:hypothetical protein
MLTYQELKEKIKEEKEKEEKEQIETFLSAYIKSAIVNKSSQIVISEDAIYKANLTVIGITDLLKEYGYKPTQEKYGYLRAIVINL